MKDKDLENEMMIINSTENIVIEDHVAQLPDEGNPYKQTLYRGFDGIMSFAFCFTAVGVIPSIALGFNSALSTGGSGEVIIAWIIGSIFCIISGLALAEISSRYPNAGSVYYWAGQLAPRSISKQVSYICAWFNILGNAAG